jgi:hypothetical protein
MGLADIAPSSECGRSLLLCRSGTRHRQEKSHAVGRLNLGRTSRLSRRCLGSEYAGALPAPQSPEGAMRPRLDGNGCSRSNWSRTFQ